MKTAILLHGMPSKEEYFDPNGIASSNRQWLPWVQHKLILAGILTQTPELPEPYEPNYEKWKSVFEQFKINEDTILVGHSCGAGFLVRWLSENKTNVGKVALVAPFLDPDHDEVEKSFFDFKIDPSLIKRTKGMSIFFSTDDDQEILTSVAQIKDAIPDIESREFSDKGHFVSESMKTDQFPELTNWLLS